MNQHDIIITNIAAAAGIMMCLAYRILLAGSVLVGDRSLETVVNAVDGYYEWQAVYVQLVAVSARFFADHPILHCAKRALRH